VAEKDCCETWRCLIRRMPGDLLLFFTSADLSKTSETNQGETGRVARYSQHPGLPLGLARRPSPGRGIAGWQLSGQHALHPLAWE